MEVTLGMYVGEAGTQIVSPVPASERVTTFQDGGRLLAVAFIAGVTWFALIGAVFGWSIVGPSANYALASVLPRNVGSTVYEINQRVPTAFGSLSLAAVDVSAGDELLASTDTMQVQLSLSVSNERDAAVWAPSVEEFRLVSSSGAEAASVGRLWNGPAVLYPHTNNSVRLVFKAPPDGGILWLEYRASRTDSPIRISLGQL